MRKRAMTRGQRRYARRFATWAAPILPLRVFRVAIDTASAFIEAHTAHEAAVRVAGEACVFSIRMDRACWYFRTSERTNRSVRVFEVCNA